MGVTQVLAPFEDRINLGYIRIRVAIRKKYTTIFMQQKNKLK